MPLDGIDKGQLDTETDEMRELREANTESAPPAQFFNILAVDVLNPIKSGLPFIDFVGHNIFRERNCVFDVI